MRDVARVLKSLADETRLHMVALLLANDELCVCDFMGVLGVSQSRASRHLRYLHQAGLVEDRREAIWVYYRLASALDPARKAILGALRRIVAEEVGPALQERLKSWTKKKCDAAKCGMPATEAARS